MLEKLFRKRQHRHRHGQDAEIVKPSDGARKTLNDVKYGEGCKIKHIHGQGAIRQRLLDIGLVPGVVITMVRSAPLDDPLEVQIDNYFITLRRAEAGQIEVTDV